MKVQLKFIIQFNTVTHKVLYPLNYNEYSIKLQWILHKIIMNAPLKYNEYIKMNTP